MKPLTQYEKILILLLGVFLLVTAWLDFASDPRRVFLTGITTGLSISLLLSIAMRVVRTKR